MENNVLSSKKQVTIFPTSKGRILLFSYAFPPMQVQMTPAVFKPMADQTAKSIRQFMA